MKDRFLLMLQSHATCSFNVQLYSFELILLILLHKAIDMLGKLYYFCDFYIRMSWNILKIPKFESMKRKYIYEASDLQCDRWRGSIIDERIYEEAYEILSKSTHYKLWLLLCYMYKKPANFRMHDSSMNIAE